MKNVNKVTNIRLRRAITLSSQKQPISNAPVIFRILIWELMKAHTKINKLEKKMSAKRKTKLVN